MTAPLRPREALAADLLAGARAELRLTPKPGLVDLEDAGSHPDLSWPLMERSLDVLGEAYRALAASLARGEPLAAQVALGQAGEARLMERCGTNTHKGALFLGGLLLAARFRAGEAAGLDALRAAVAEVAHALLDHRRLPESHGEAARRRFRVGGIVREALGGLPSLFEVALPALGEAGQAGLGGAGPAFLALARLMQVVEDTTALHRCGEAGLAVMKADGAALEARLLAGEDPAPWLRERNEVWRATRLTMGGVADLLGMALGVAAHRAPPARFARYVLRTTDVTAAASFYDAVVGRRGDGIVPLPPAALARGAVPHWLGLVGCGDLGGVEAVAARLLARGATRLGPPGAPRPGEPVVLREAGGAVLGLTDEAGPSAAGVGWHALNTADEAGAAATCAEAFGWAPGAPGSLGDFRALAWSAGEPGGGAIAGLAGRPGVHPHWLFCFEVPSLDAALAAARRGGAVTLAPVALPGGLRIAACDDPQGAAFGLVERA